VLVSRERRESLREEEWLKPKLKKLQQSRPSSLIGVVKYVCVIGRYIKLFCIILLLPFVFFGLIAKRSATSAPLLPKLHGLCLLDILMCRAKTDEPIHAPLAMWTLATQRITH